MIFLNGIYTVVIPEGLTEISSNAFNNCQNLTSVIWNAVNCTAPTSEADAPFYAIRTKIRSFAFGESVKKEDETPLYTKSGSFKTIGTATSLDQTSQEPRAKS